MVVNGNGRGELSLLDSQLLSGEAADTHTHTHTHTHTARRFSTGGCGCYETGTETSRTHYGDRLHDLLALEMSERTNGLELTSFEAIRPKSVRQYNPDPTVADYESGEALLREWIYNFK